MIVNVTPKMKSNTTPYPYLCKASSAWPGYDAYRAFNGNDTSDDYWHVNNGRTGWLIFDFKSRTYIDCIKITNTYHTSYMPYQCIVSGSNDGINFEIIETIKSSFGNQYVFLKKKQFYRAYKFDMATTGTYLSVQELTMFEDTSKPRPASNRIKQKAQDVFNTNKLFQTCIFAEISTNISPSMAIYDKTKRLLESEE